MKIDFKEEVKINKYKLYDECERQVVLYHTYSKLLADAKSDLSEQSNRITLLESDADLSVRKNWREDRNGKLTEAGVRSKVAKNPDIKAAHDEFLRINRDVNALEAAVKTLEHRKRSLDNMVTLLVNGFYSMPKGKRPVENIDGSSDEVRQKLNRRRKNGSKE